MIFQPTNVYPDVKGGMGNGIVDADDVLTVSWQVNGNSPLLSFEIAFYYNTSTSTLVYTTGQISDNCPFYGVDASGNVQFMSYTMSDTLDNLGFANDSEYKIIIKQWYGAGNDDYVLQTSASVFITRDKPTLTMDAIPTPIIDRSNTFTATYSQAQGDALNWVRWQIAFDDDTDNPFYDSGDIYGTAELAVSYDGFFTGNTYAIKCAIQTENGVEVDTGWVQFTVSYDEEAVTGEVTASCTRNKSAVHVEYSELTDLEAPLTSLELYRRQGTENLLTHVASLDTTFATKEIDDYGACSQQGEYEYYLVPTIEPTVEKSAEGAVVEFEGTGLAFTEVVAEIEPEQTFPASTLPSGYTDVEYIESTGTQYIDTGIDVTTEYMRYIGKFSFDTIPNDLRPFGHQRGSIRSGMLYGTNGAVYAGSSNAIMQIGTLATNTDYAIDLTVNNGDATFVANGITKFATYTGTIAYSGGNIFLFAMNSYGTPASGAMSGKCYYFKIYQGTTLVRDFVPCKRDSDGVLGMYDLVTNTFYTNAGTGTFTANASPWVSPSAYKLPYISSLANNGNLPVGNRESGSIVGGTVAWNQLADPKTTTASQVTATVTDGHVVVSGTSDGTGWFTAYVEPDAIDNHVYLAMATDYNEHGDTYNLCLLWNFSQVWNFSSQGYATIVKNTGAYSKIRMAFNRAVGATYAKEYTPQIFDLTQMLGTTIADYIYGLEQAIKGAGVAYFRSMFPNNYYAYDTGSLQSVNTSGHKITGKNLVKIATGSTTNQGITFAKADGKVTMSGTCGTSNAWHTVSANDFLLKAGTYILSGGGNENVMMSLRTPSPTNTEIVNTQNGNAVFTLAEDTVVLLRCRVKQNYAISGSITFYPQIEWGNFATAWQIYSENTYALDDSLTLRGLPKLDANNGLYYDGDEYVASGNVKRRYKSVDMGTLNWGYQSTDGFFGVSIGDIKYKCQLVTTDYTFVGTKTDTEMASVANMSIADNGGIWIKIKNTAYTDATAFTNAMSGKYLQYELATPTTESADPYTALQEVTYGSLEQFTDYGVSQGTRDVAIPVGHKTYYMNYCPISGYTGMNLPHTGKNLVDIDNYGSGNFPEAGKMFIKAGTYYAVRFSAGGSLNTVAKYCATENGTFVNIPTDDSSDYAKQTAAMQWNVPKSIITIKKDCWIAFGCNANTGSEPYSVMLSLDDAAYNAVTGAEPIGGTVYNQYFEPYDGTIYTAIWGKNKLQNTVAVGSHTINGLTYTVNADGSVVFTAGGTASALTSIDLANTEDIANGSYILNGCPSGGGSSTYGLYVNDKADTTLANTFSDTGSGANVTISNGGVYRPRIIIRSGYTIPTGGLTFKPMLRISTDADATFAPYVTGTVYGANVDVISGEIDETKFCILLDGSENWVQYGNISTPSNVGLFFYDLDSSHAQEFRYNLFTNYLSYDNNVTSDVTKIWYFGLQGSAENYYRLVVRTPFTTVQEWKDFLSANLQVCGIYQTPNEYSLTPQPIDTLAGDNVIWNDIGNTKVKYIKDTVQPQPLISNKICPMWWNWTVLECEQDGDGIYEVINEFNFGKNLSSGKISNNNVPNILNNFTPYPTVQTTPQNYQSGTLQSLIGVISQANGNIVYSDTIALRNMIYALSVTRNTLFLKNRKGDLIKIKIAGAITMETSDDTREQMQTMELPWVEIGNVSGTSIIGY